MRTWPVESLLLDQDQQYTLDVFLDGAIQRLEPLEIGQLLLQITKPEALEELEHLLVACLLLLGRGRLRGQQLMNCAHEHVGAALEEQVADLHKSLDFGVVLQVILPQLEPLNERVK